MIMNSSLKIMIIKLYMENASHLVKLSGVSRSKRTSKWFSGRLFGQFIDGIFGDCPKFSDFTCSDEIIYPFINLPTLQ